MGLEHAKAAPAECLWQFEAKALAFWISTERWVPSWLGAWVTIALLDCHFIFFPDMPGVYNISVHLASV